MRILLQFLLAFLVSILPVLRLSAEEAAPSMNGVITARLKPMTDHQPGGYCLRFKGRPSTPSDALPPAVSAAKSYVFEKVPHHLNPVLVEPDKNGGASRLWLDLDGNGFKGETKCFDIYPDKKEWFKFTSAIEDLGHRHKCEFSCRVFHEQTAGSWTFTLQACMGFSGDLLLPTGSRGIVIESWNSDGRLEKAFQPFPPEKPPVHVIIGKSGESKCSLPLARNIALDSMYYSVDLAFESGETEFDLLLTLMPRHVETVDVTVLGEGVEQVLLHNADSSLLLSPEGRKLKVPEGDWKVTKVYARFCGDYLLNAEFGSYSDKTIPTLQVVEGSAIELKAGGPFGDFCTITGNWSGSLRLAIHDPQDAFGNRYSFQADDIRWDVATKGGSVVSAGNFEFG